MTSGEPPGKDSIFERRRLFTIASAALAFFVLTVFVLGLRDAPLRRLPERAASATVSADAKKARVCVTLVDKATSRPIAGTTRAYLEQPDRRYAAVGSVETRDDEPGCLLLPHGALWFLSEAEGKARASTHIVLDAERALRIELVAAVVLSVNVQDELGAALPKATVLVTASDPLPYGMLTDASGKARFDWLPPAPFNVRVAAPGYESVERRGVRADLSVSLRRLSAIDVRVVDASGAPAGNAAVLIAGSSLWPARRAECNADGVAKIRGLSAGSYDLRALRGGDVSAPVLGFELARGAQETLTLRLEPGRTVTALVTDGSGESAPVVPNADVVLVEGGLGAFPLRGRTGSDGRVSLGPISKAPATLGASAPDFVPGQLVAVPDVLEGPVRVPLLRGGTLRGDVVDAHDRPIAGATVEVVGTDRSGLPIAQSPESANFRAAHFEWSLRGPPGLIAVGELGVMPGPVPPIPPPGAGSSALPAADALAAQNVLAPWVTSANGEFVARPIMPGQVRALVRHPEFVEGASQLVSLSSGGEAHVKVVLLRGGSLEGRVVDERGFPVPNVEVQVVADRGTFERSTITASDGAFAFAAVPENVVVSVARPEDRARVAVKKRVRVAEGGRERIELVVPPPREPVQIRVVDDRETPIELAEIHATSLDPSITLRATVFTNEAGHAELSDALDVPLRLVVEAPRFARLEKSFEHAPKQIQLTLDPGVLVSGRVTAVRGRRAVQGAVVTLRVGARRTSSMTDADGNYRFTNVAVGQAEISVSHPDFASGHASASIERTTRVDRPFELPTIDLSEAGEVAGEVIDERGRPVEGARVAVGLSPAFLPTGALPEGVALTDSRGAFTLRGIGEGSVKLSAHAPGIGRGSVSGVNVRPGRTTSGVSIRLSERADADTLGAASLAVTLVERGAGDAVEISIAHVASGSEAERAGLAVGDVIKSIDGERPRSLADARTRLSGREGSDTVLELARSGAALKLRVPREAVRN
ncbi:MAG: carboxypeptidase regulatory-like domain-containing protein [Myxococcota bacterium]